MTDEQWSQSTALNRFAGIALFALALGSAVYAFLEHRWFSVGTDLALAGGMFYLYWTAIRPAERRKAEERRLEGGGPNQRL